MKESTVGALNRLVERDDMECYEKQIKCPYCGWENDEEEKEHDFISYHGERSGEFECPAPEDGGCGKTFSVQEVVTRTFHCTQLECRELDERDKIGYILANYCGDIDDVARVLNMPASALLVTVLQQDIDWRQYPGGIG